MTDELNKARQRSFRRRPLIGALLVAAGVFAPGMSWGQSVAGDWNAIVVAAKKEGRVTFYNSVTPRPVARAIAGFKKLHPEIELVFLRGPSGQLLSKVEQERNNNADGADVLISTEINWYLARAKENRLLKLVGPQAKSWPAKYAYEGSIVILDHEPFVIAYNRNEIKSNPPKGYADLLRPEYKGRIGITELASTTVIGWYDWLEKTQGPDFLPKLKAQNLKFYVGSVPGAQAVASGEIAVSSFNSITSVTSLVEQGAPIEIIVPSPGLGVQHAAAVFAWSKRPNASLVFVDYLMSRDGQTAWNGAGESASPLPNIPGALSAETITPVDVTKYPAEVAKAYRERWNKLMK